MIDFILGGLLLYGLIKGLWKGLLAEMAGLVSLLLGLFVAVKFSGFTAKLLEGHVSWNPKYIAITAFAITFIAVVAGVILLGKVATKLASFAALGWVNRLFGGIFGFLKMVLILSVSLNFFLKINSNNTFAEQKTLDKSLFFYPILKVSNTIFPVLEEWFAEFRKKEPAKTEE
jgi:membrane protein required for colicin V production